MEIEPVNGYLYIDKTKNKWCQYCPVHGWIDVTDLEGNYDKELFEPHRKCGNESNRKL